MRRHRHTRRSARLDFVRLQVILYIVRQGLAVGSTSTATGVNVLGKLRNLVRDAVGNVRAGGDARVGAQNDAALKGNGHNGRARQQLGALVGKQRRVRAGVA